MLLALNATCVITCYKISKGECRFYLEDGTYDAQSLCIKKYCYCFPEQVKVDKPCPEVQYSDYKQLMGVACLETIPNGTRTPEITPDSTPQLTPYQTPQLTPELTPYQTPELTPQLTPEQTANYTVPRTEEPSISFKIIEEQQSKVYIYTTIGFFALLFIIILIVIIYCCHKKREDSSAESIDAEEVPVILPTQDFPITITLDEFPSYSDPFSEDFQVSDEYFDALEKEN